MSGNIRLQSSQLAEPLWTDPGIKSGISVRELISTLKKKKKKPRRRTNGRTFPQNPRKRAKSHQVNIYIVFPPSSPKSFSLSPQASLRPQIFPPSPQVLPSVFTCLHTSRSLWRHARPPLSGTLLFVYKKSLSHEPFPRSPTTPRQPPSRFYLLLPRSL